MQKLDVTAAAVAMLALPVALAALRYQHDVAARRRIRQVPTRVVGRPALRRPVRVPTQPPGPDSLGRHPAANDVAR